MRNRLKPDFKKTAGFTLIELMVVIVILGVLAAVIVPNFMGRPDDARREMAKTGIRGLDTGLKLFKLDNGFYPTTEMGLQALISPPETGAALPRYRKGGYIESKKVPKDPWGNDYIYISPGNHGYFDIISYGADGIAGGEGANMDINSWEIE